MKKSILLIASILLVLTSCTPAGTVENVDRGDNDSINLVRYYYADGNSIYLATMKQKPNVITATYQTGGKNKTTHIDVTITPESKNEVIYENDSILVIRKH